jgi:hypothetical protein
MSREYPVDRCEIAGRDCLRQLRVGQLCKVPLPLNRANFLSTQPLTRRTKDFECHRVFDAELLFQRTPDTRGERR